MDAPWTVCNFYLFVFLEDTMNLILLLLIPFVQAIFVSLVRRIPKEGAFIMSLVPLLLLIVLPGDWIGSKVQFPWFEPLSIQFYLSVDSLSLVFLYLTAIVIPFSLLAVPSEINHSKPIFYALVLVTQGLLFGFFMARDLFLFAIFFEAMLFPLFLIISMWGGDNRERVAFKFILFMIGGSALMILAIIALFLTSGTLDIGQLSSINNIPYASLLFLLFVLAFAVKTPLFPFHGWLPETYTVAPFGGSILLAAVLSKGGIYGLARIGLEIFPEQMRELSPWLLTLALIGVLWGGLAAWVQSDFKRLIAYSSFSHVNFVLAGLFVMNEIAVSGSLLQAFNHGITITSLFLVAGWLKERLGTTSIIGTSGLAKFLPHLCWLTLFFVLASIALPGTNSFIGELLILYGLFLRNAYAAAVLGCGVILSAIYMLRWMQKTYFEAPSFFKESWIDIQKKEFLIALPLIVIILWIGIYPSPMIKLSNDALKMISLSTEF